MDYNDATLETKVNEEKIFSLREVAFIYLKEYEKRNYPENISFDQIENEKNKISGGELIKIIDDIDNGYKNYSKYLKDISRIFRIEIFWDRWKSETGEYEFYESDVEFLCNLLYKYQNEKIWKKIRKVDNSKFDGFVNLYRQGTIELLDELRFVVDGFVAMCEKRCEGKDAEIDDFEYRLLIYTQLRQIKCMEKMKEILFSLPTLSLDEICNSPAGILLEDYQKFLYLVQGKLSEVISNAKKFWEQDVEKRKQELDELIILYEDDDEFTELFNYAIEQSHILENDNNIENCVSSKDRLNMSKKRKENEDAIEKLPEEEKDVILQVVDHLYNGH